MHRILAEQLIERFGVNGFNFDGGMRLNLQALQCVGCCHQFEDFAPWIAKCGAHCMQAVYMVGHVAFRRIRLGLGGEPFLALRFGFPALFGRFGGLQPLKAGTRFSRPFGGAGVICHADQPGWEKRLARRLLAVVRTD